MISPATSQVLALADSSGWQTCAEKTRDERGEDGQFFSPPPIARCLAGWFQPEGFNRPKVHLLDPGAGGGVLTAAVVDRITALRADKALPKLRASSYLPLLPEGESKDKIVRRINEIRDSSSSGDQTRASDSIRANKEN